MESNIFKTNTSWRGIQYIQNYHKLAWDPIYSKLTQVDMESNIFKTNTSWRGIQYIQN